MCGIAGYYSVKGRFDKSDLITMNNAISHRGPDAEGYFEEDSCGFAHRRLSIIDLSRRADQPMISSNERYVIVFNGEIYNFSEIGARLKSLSLPHENVMLKTSSDTEVLLEAFAVHGVDFVHQLNGMFAIAIYDRKTGDLYLFRDRLGIKPLFYYWDGSDLLFASELKAIQQISKIKLTVRSESISSFLHLGFIPAPHSIYTNVFKLESGTWMKVTREGISTTRYWSTTSKLSNNLIRDKEQALVKLSDLIISSVQFQLKSDVPFGVFLSGGIDSSLITAQAVELSSVKVKTFSIGFEENSHNESEYAKAVAKYLGTEHHEFIVSNKDAIDLVDPMFETYDEPFADSSAIPTMLVSKLAKQYVTVTLSGEGGDELFLGYGAYRWAQRLNNPLLSMSRHLLSGISNHMSSRYQRVGRMLDYDNSTDLRSHILSQEQYLFSEDEISDLLINPSGNKLKLSEDVSDNNLLRLLNDRFTNNISFHERRLTAMERQALFDLRYYLQDDLLTKVDRASMLYSLETRVPYLDHRLVELSLNIHPGLKFHKDVSKYILKEILYKYIPRHIFERPKQGFAIPMGKWLKKELAYLIDDYLSETSVNNAGVVKYETVKKLVSDFRNGKDFLYNRIWLLITLHRWMKRGNVTAYPKVGFNTSSGVF